MENNQLRRAVSDLTIEKLILKEAAFGNFQAPPIAALVELVVAKHDIYERLACRVLGRFDRHKVRSRQDPMMRQH